MATATADIYTLSLHDALPILEVGDVAGPDRIESSLVPSPLGVIGEASGSGVLDRGYRCEHGRADALQADRKSTRLNSSHVAISYAVFCLKKKNDTQSQSRSSV